MPLNTAALKASIKSAYQSVQNYDGSPGQTQADALEAISTALSAAITTFVMSGTVTVTTPPGVLVQVTCPAGTGATTGPGVGTGSVA